MTNSSPSKWIVLIISIMLVLPSALHACVFTTTVNWTGNVDSDWNNTANYSAVPASGDNVTIDPANFTGTAASPVISANSTWNPRRVRVQNAASLTIQADLSTSNVVQVTGVGSKITQSGGIVTVNTSTRDVDLSTSGEYEMSGGTLNCRDLAILSGTGVLDFDGGTLNVNRNLSVNGTLEIDASGISGVGTNTFSQSAGTVSITSGATFPPSFETVTLTAGEVDYAGGSQDVAHQSGGAITYNDLTISGSGTKSMTGDIDVDGNVSIDGGRLFATLSDYDLTVAGDFDNNVGSGGFAANNATVTMDGSAAQDIDGSSNFYNLTINNASGVTIASGTDSLQGTLTLSAGTFTTGGYLVFQSTATESARLAEIAGGASISGDITVLRYLGISTDDWRLLSAPVSGLTLHDWNDDMTTSGFTGSNWPGFTFVSMYTYDESETGARDEGFKAPGTIGDGISAGVGYNVYMGADAQMLDVTGPAHTGSTDLNVSWTDDPLIDDAEDGWNLVGNPFPSTLDWDAASGWTKTNVEDAVYIWNATAGQFATYIKGAATHGGSQYITHSQAFWVKTNASSPSLIVDEPAKVRKDSTFIKANSGNDVLVISLDGNGYSDETVIRVDETAMPEFEASSDAHKLTSMQPSAPYLASVDPNDVDMAINALPWDNGRLSVPLRTQSFVAGTSSFTIAMDVAGTSLATSCVMLEDLLLGTMTDLRINSYTFSQSDTDSDARFVLHVAEALPVEGVSIGCNGATDGSIALEGEGAGPWTYEYFNAQGALIQSELSTQSTHTATGLAAGMYSFSIEDHNDFNGCSVRHGEFTVDASYFMEGTPTIQDASCAGLTDASAVVDVVGGLPPYDYDWSTGVQTMELYGVGAGMYDVLVTDANGCGTLVEVNIAEPAAVEAQFELPATTLYLSLGAAFEPTNSSSGATDYLWDFGTGTTSTDSEPSYTFTTEGTYTVTLQASNGSCTNQTTATIIVLAEPTGIEQLAAEAGQIRLLQQGGGYYINAALEQPKPLTVTVLDQTGRLVAQPAINSTNSRIALPVDVAAGMYLVRVEGLAEALTFKMVVQ